MCPRRPFRRITISAEDRYPILTGYDGSTASRRALAKAAGMARRLDHWLVVVHVWRPIVLRPCRLPS